MFGILLITSENLLSIFSIFRWFLEIFKIFQENFGNFRISSDDFWKSAVTFQNPRVIFENLRNMSSGNLRHFFGNLRKSSDFRSTSDGLQKSGFSEFLRNNFGNGNLHCASVTLFALALHFLYWCYTSTGTALSQSESSNFFMYIINNVRNFSLQHKWAQRRRYTDFTREAGGTAYELYTGNRRLLHATTFGWQHLVHHFLGLFHRAVDILIMLNPDDFSSAHGNLRNGYQIRIVLAKISYHTSRLRQPYPPPFRWGFRPILHVLCW